MPIYSLCDNNGLGLTLLKKLLKTKCHIIDNQNRQKVKS